MGDSYSSGTGIHKSQSDYHNGDACCRDFETTPGSKLARLEGKEHIIPACAGDEIPQIFDQFTAMQADYPEEAARGWEDSVIMLTIGGNDIRSNAGRGWADILVNCIIGFYDDCHKEDGNQVANFDEVPGLGRHPCQLHHRLLRRLPQGGWEPGGQLRRGAGAGPTSLSTASSAFTTIATRRMGTRWPTSTRCRGWADILVNCIIGFYDDCHKEDGNQ